ncbi:MAG TPA: hypothetical protein VFD28_04495 [Candidatus Eisenbacteria bacterium]|nr:hypothetical protein [Candidatus Eisenbacteria bacterium]
MSDKSLIGQNNLKNRLRDALALGHPLQHAYLFCADKGMGKKSFALTFAQEILCLNNKDSLSQGSKSKRACGLCDSCRFFKAETHPDFKIVDREQDSVIKVARIRKEIVSDIQLRPQLSNYKIYFIDADGLNKQGQNALLKSLEEPPKHAVFLLTVTFLDNLLATILSRVAVLNFQPYTDSEIKEILKNNGIDSNLKFIIQYAAGNPGAAIQISADETFQEVRKRAFNLFFQLPTIGRTELLTNGIDFFQKVKDQADLVFDLWQGLLHDILVLLENDKVDSLSQKDLKERLKKLADYYLREKNIQTDKRKEQLLDAYEAITEVRKARIVNASYEGMIGQLLLTMRKDLYIDG